MPTVITKSELIGKTGFTLPVKYACEYTCECGEKVLYLDENGRPDRLVKCDKCIWGET